MWARTILFWCFLSLLAVICVAGRAVAELMTALFPDGVPGYDEDEGVTVETRLHPEQMPLGVREGAFVFVPRLDEGFGYSSNALPGPYRRGSFENVTAAALSVKTEFSRNNAGASVSVRDTRTLSLPSQDRTDATVSVGGRIDVGEDTLTLGGAHLAQHEDRGDLDTIASDRPIGFQIDDVRATYAMIAGRWTIEPNVQAANWTYDPTTILGVAASEAYRDRLVLQSGLTLRYEFAPLRSAIFVARMIGQDYTHTPAGQPSPDSTSFQVLAGIDYDDDAVWRWRVLAGGEARQFASPFYRPRNTLIAEAGAGWSPSGLTTLTATVSRETGDAEQEGVAGLIYTAARLTIDHEYLRNLVLRASFGWQRADFFDGGYQVGTTAGAGMTWVINRSARLSVTYVQSDLRGSRVPSAAAMAGYSRGLGLLTMSFGL